VSIPLAGTTSAVGKFHATPAGTEKCIDVAEG
jgi:hypothetical protein